MKNNIKMADAEIDAENEKEQIDFKLDELLRKKGWEHTSDTPGCVWLWKRRLPDRKIILVNRETAIHMQAWVDEYGEKNETRK